MHSQIFWNENRERIGLKKNTSTTTYLHKHTHTHKHFVRGMRAQFPKKAG